MFTGIIEEMGTVRETGERLRVEASKVLLDSRPGSSIAVNGVCLTAVEVTRDGEGGPGELAFELSPETTARTALGRLRPGDRVNLERPVTLLTRLGGHLVQGHVDGVGTILSVQESAPGMTMMVTLPDELRSYVVEKGSIALDGISLTVTTVREGAFAVALVPFTLAATTLGRAGAGDPVNLEVDVIARYLQRLMIAGG